MEATHPFDVVILWNSTHVNIFQEWDQVMSEILFAPVIIIEP